MNRQQQRDARHRAAKPITAAVVRRSLRNNRLPDEARRIPAYRMRVPGANIKGLAQAFRDKILSRVTEPKADEK